MFRNVISDGDLLTLYRPWYSFGKWRPYRNLSEEVRLLKEHEEDALSKYLDLARKHVIASTNVAEELETLQILLLDNSEAAIEYSVDNSILEQREGVKYNFNRGGNNKQGKASSNKENQGQKKQQNNGNNQGKPKGLTLFDLMTRGRITIH